MTNSSNRSYDQAMIARKILSLSLFALQSLCAMPLAEHINQTGYIEICDKWHSATTFDGLYTYFDKLVEFLQRNPIWVRKLYNAKERFIRSKDRHYYSTDVFGFYDESKRIGRDQISFYYSIHFHQFISRHYPEFNQIPEIIKFFDACKKIQDPYPTLFTEAALELGLEAIFSSGCDHPPLLLKVVKYLSSYIGTRPHYDGTVFSLFLHSTDNQSLRLSPYKSSFQIEDFSSPGRREQNSILLIPGELLTEFSIYPTPHIVVHSGRVRYATIAFAMRPNCPSQNIDLSPLPKFKH